MIQAAPAVAPNERRGWYIRWKPGISIAVIGNDWVREQNGSIVAGYTPDELHEVLQAVAGVTFEQEVIEADVARHPLRGLMPRTW